MPQEPHGDFTSPFPTRASQLLRGVREVVREAGSGGIPCHAVLDAVRNYLLDTGHVGIYLPAFRKETYARVESVRAATACFLNADADEIAFTKNASEAN